MSKKKKMEIVSQTLPCKLNDEDRLRIGKRMSENYQRMGQKQAELKSLSAEYKSQIASLESEIMCDSGKIQSGIEHRPVDCYWQKDFDKKTKALIRIDTGEETNERYPLTEEDMQEQIEFPEA